MKITSLGTSNRNVSLHSKSFWSPRGIFAIGEKASVDGEALRVSERLREERVQIVLKFKKDNNISHKNYEEGEQWFDANFLRLVDGKEMLVNPFNK